MYPIWYKEETLETQVTAESQVTTASNHTLYAKWIESETSFAYTGDIQTYVVPETGIYKLEVSGAGGKTWNQDSGKKTKGGSGGYSSGYTVLEAGDVLYIAVGGRGSNSGGGYNGGAGDKYGAGGGASHIAKMTGTLEEIGAANLSKILLVAGGGGGSGYRQDRKDETIREYWFSGGNGGGESGTASTFTVGKKYSNSVAQNSSAAGTSTGGYSFGKAEYGGGGGLYGGYGSLVHGGGGGSGYIGGVPEFTYNETTYSPISTAGAGSIHDADGCVKITFIPTGDVYKVSFNTNGGDPVNAILVNRTGTYGALPTPTKFGNTFDGWYKDAALTTQVTAETQVTTASNHTLYAKWTPNVFGMSVGDYVTYTPNGNSVDLTNLTGISHTNNFDPKSTTAWRVISNNGTTIELVSAESVGDLTLGQYCEKHSDGSILYGSDTAININKTNYANIVKILNDISATYETDGITSGSRALGSKAGYSQDVIDSPDLAYGREATFPYNDDYEQTDFNTITTNGMYHSSGVVWMGNRYLSSDDNCTHYGTTGLGTDTQDYTGYLYNVYDSGYIHTQLLTRGVRPVVLIEDSIGVTGSGTSTNPWIIN